MLIGGLSSPASEVRCSSVAITFAYRWPQQPGIGGEMLVGGHYLDSPIP